MPRIDPFEKFPQDYDEWFEVHKAVYESELQAIRAVLPAAVDAVEVGVGTGRFAVPLGIKGGVEPSGEMRRIARARGIDAVDGVAESLPYADETLDLVLMVTTICFVDDIDAAFKEAFRVLRRERYLLIGFVDRKSCIGQLYEQNKHASHFYRAATFYSVDEVLEHLAKAGFSRFYIVQTVFHDLQGIVELEPVEEGYGKGSFVAIRSMKVDKSSSTG
jgi:ubiquinone/menaquinone biosynthesis C-methylase UbiE